MSSQLERIRKLLAEIDTQEMSRGSSVPSLVALDQELTHKQDPGPTLEPIRVSIPTGAQVKVEVEGEWIELRSTGDSIEICFADGKAFHIPKKAVA